MRIMLAISIHFDNERDGIIEIFSLVIERSSMESSQILFKVNSKVVELDFISGGGYEWVVCDGGIVQKAARGSQGSHLSKATCIAWNENNWNAGIVKCRINILFAVEM